MLLFSEFHTGVKFRGFYFTSHICKLRKPNPPSKQVLAREYGVSKKAIQKTWENRVAIEQRSSLMSVETKAKTFHASVRHFSEVNDKLYIWIERMN